VRALQTFVRDSKLSFSKFKTDIDSSKSWRLSPAKPIGTTCSVASLLAATFHQGNSDRNYKLWNIGSTEIYTPCAGDLVPIGLAGDSLHDFDESMSVLNFEKDNLLSLTNVCKTYILNTKPIHS
jgi:hypothetical protein